MKCNKTRRILVLDADMVPALTIARSLAKRSCAVDTASHELKPLTYYSSSANESYQYPNPLLEEKAFIDWVVKHTRLVAYDLLIPVTERTLVVLSAHRDRLEHIRVAMPSQLSLELALDKQKTIQLAKRVGVPVPAGVYVKRIEDLNSPFTKFAFPVVIKPARSLGRGDKGSSQLQVSYASNDDELRACCEHGLKFGPVLLQEHIRGKGVGIELIARNGHIVYAFQHLRLHEVPLTGGGSSLRVSTALDSKLLEASTRLMKELGWNGVAMVEFKWDQETEEYSLMEINGRFWGSLPLSVAAGADFPAMLLDLELSDRSVPSASYKNGIYCRKLSRDLFWYEAILRGGAKSKIVNIPERLSVFKELSLFFSPSHYFDVQSFRDPLPGLVDIGRIAGSYMRRFIKAAEDRLFVWRQLRAWKRGDVANAIAEANSMLFICYGNINRSAVAEAIIRSHTGSSGPMVVSAGLHPVAGREADPVMVDIASKFGIDLGRSRSITVSKELIAKSDIIFAMEKRHIDALSSICKGSENKAWLLGAHEGRDAVNAEISDPYGSPKSEYEKCFHRIAEAVSYIENGLP